MTTTELIAKVAENSGITKLKTRKIVNEMLNVMVDTLENFFNNDIRLTGFGTFKVVNRKARAGRHPQTGEPIQIPEKKKVVFRAGKQLRNL